MVYLLLAVAALIIVAGIIVFANRSPKEANWSTLQNYYASDDDEVPAEEAEIVNALAAMGINLIEGSGDEVYFDDEESSWMLWLDCGGPVGLEYFLEWECDGDKLKIYAEDRGIDGFRIVPPQEVQLFRKVLMLATAEHLQGLRPNSYF